MTAAAMERHGLTFEERIQLLEEFARLEQFDATCSVRHAMAVLDCAQSTLYANRKLMAKRVRRGSRGIGFKPSDIRAAQRLRGGLN